MKKTIIYLVAILSFSCTKELVLREKRGMPSSLLSSDSIVFTVTDVNGFQTYPDSIFTSPVFIGAIKVHYNEPLNPNLNFNTPRIFEMELVDNDQENIFTYPDSVFEFAKQGYIRGAVFATQTILYDNLNIRCSEFSAYAMVETNKTFTITIYTIPEPDTLNQVVTFMLWQDYDNVYPLNKNFQFNDDILIRHMKAQQWGRLNRGFNVSGNAINISNSTSVTNIKDFEINSNTDTLSISMQSVPPLPYSGAGYLNYGDLTLVTTIMK